MPCGLQRLDQAAEAYLGVPFHHQGRCEAGMDCVGLVVLSARDIGVELVDYAHYRQLPNPRELLRRMKLNPMERVDREPEPGDILLFWYRRGSKMPQHMGLMSDDGYMIHAHGGAGRVVKHRLDDNWRGRLHSVWQLQQAA